MLIPVWSATWEIECCQPEAVVGSKWSVPIAFRPGADPWWEEYARSATPMQRSLGTVRLEVIVEREAASGAVLAASGPLHFRMGAAPPSGPVIGRLSVDAHATDGSITNDETTVAGSVARVQIVPLRFEKRDGAFVPVEQLEPVEAQSTLERDSVTTSPLSGASELIQPDLLVWLELEGA